MRVVRKSYQMWGPDVPEGVRYYELQGLKNALREAGFRWTKNPTHSVLELDIHDGGDILCDDRYRVGEVKEGHIVSFGSSRLEQFLDAYPDCTFRPERR